MRDCWDNTREFDYELATLLQRFEPPASWKYNPRASQKAPCGFVGLRNLGCICYMISLMQQFFMIPAFRYNLLCVDDQAPEDLQEYKSNPAL